MLKRLVSLLILCSFTLEASAYTIYDAIISAHENNPDIISKAKSLKATKMNRYIALSGFLPQAQASSQYSKAKGNRAPIRGSTSSGRTNTLSLTQPIFQGGKTLANIGKAENAILASVYEFNNNSAALSETVVQTYENVDLYKSLLALSQENEDGYKKTLESAEIRFKFGDSTITEVYNARAYYEDAKARTEMVRSNFASSQANFEYQVGYTMPEQHDPLVLDEASIPESLAEAIELAIASNPQVRSAYYNSQAASFDVGVKASDLLPSVQAQFAHTKTNDARDSISSNSFSNNNNSATISVSVPIFSGSLYPSIAQSKYSAESAKYSYRNAVEAIKAQTVSTWNNYLATKASLEAQRLSAESFRLAYEGFKEEVKIGTNTIVVLLDAQRNYYNQLIQLRQKEAEHKLSIYRLMRITNLIDSINIDKIKMKDDN